MQIGQEYWWTDPEDGEYAKPQRVVIIGFDPFEKKWVGACKEWLFSISHIDDDDLEVMELI